MMKEEHKQCEYDGCSRAGPFALYLTYPGGTKHWINVCDQHERVVAQENLKRAGGHLPTRRNAE